MFLTFRGKGASSICELARWLHKDRGRFSLGGGRGENLKPLVRLILRRALSRLALLRAQRERRNGKEGEEGKEGKGERLATSEQHKEASGGEGKEETKEGRGKEESEQERERRTRTRKKKKGMQKADAR